VVASKEQDMTDKQLLRDAAKAAGIKLVFDSYGLPRDCTGIKPAMDILSAKVWNPLIDDGDAQRLLVALKIDILFDEESDNSVVVAQTFRVFESETINDDPYAATRRAIVRAAAEIGRSKT